MVKRISFSFVVFVGLVATAVAQSSSELQSTVALFQKVRTVLVVPADQSTRNGSRPGRHLLTT